MSITDKDIRHLAKLSRLRVSDDDLEMYRSQIGSILEYVAKLQSVETKGVPELAHGVPTTNVFRKDEMTACDPSVREQIMKNFPEREGDLLKVQAVFEERTE